MYYYYDRCAEEKLTLVISRGGMVVDIVQGSYATLKKITKTKYAHLTHKINLDWSKYHKI